jgi:hypothetical protein
MPRQLLLASAILDPIPTKVLFAWEPSVAIAAIHTTIIRANITAYSTAVGPSSRRRNSADQRRTLRMTREGVWVIEKTKVLSEVTLL